MKRSTKIRIRHRGAPDAFLPCRAAVPPGRRILTGLRHGFPFRGSMVSALRSVLSERCLAPFEIGIRHGVGSSPPLSQSAVAASSRQSAARPRQKNGSLLESAQGLISACVKTAGVLKLASALHSLANLLCAPGDGLRAVLRMLKVAEITIYRYDTS